jgi:FAD/FMN-containing dehydrogenase/Fe-S oxidoreductase
MTTDRSLERALREAVRGEVRFDPFSRVLYSTDASLYQVVPVGVVVPRDEQDVANALRIAAETRTPVVARGGGTSLAGQSIGRALVLDFSKYMDRIVHLDPSGPYAVVQPGVVQDELNRAAQPYGLRLGPDTSTSNRATLGGMIGNNSCGSRSLVYGKTMDHLLELRVLLWDGTETTLRPLDEGAYQARLADPGREGEIYRTLRDLLLRHAGEIERRFPKLLRRVSGYNLDALLRNPADLTQLVAGSEGTLAVVTEARVRLVPRPRHTGLCVLHFPDVFTALDSTPAILRHRPTAVELIDRMILEMTRGQLEYARRMTFVQGDPGALLVVEVADDAEDAVADRIAALEADLVGSGPAYASVRVLDPAAQDNVWRVRKAGQGLLQGVRGERKPLAFVEDTAVPPERLGAYMRRVQGILDREGVQAAFYAHASVGCIHVRPLLNPKDREDLARMVRIAEAVGELVIEFGGAMSGEHGDGMVRSWFVERYFGPQVYSAFRAVKRLFDPHNLMNPGKIVDGPAMDASLRYGPDYRTVHFPTVFDWSREGGFAAAVEQCSGVGACRKKLDGVMCPSYMATREEEHSTRGRANLLRAALSGLLPPEELRGPRMVQALDLCLECKACKAECPASVDMAKLKAEVLHAHRRAHRTSARDWAFAHVRLGLRVASALAPLVRWATVHPAVRGWLDRAGVDRRRPLPPLARPTFLQWWSRRQPASQGDRGTVALFADTFTLYSDPGPGVAAVEVLERLGYRVVLAPPVCCGRPLVSKGFLDEAQRNARRALAHLAPLVRQGVPVVGLEPSCVLTFRDEVRDLVPGEEATAAARGLLLLDEFLDREQAVALPRLGPDGVVVVHGHCHQRALVGTGPLLRTLRAAGYEPQEVDSGCCGMAGSFGYEREHYELSLAIGERRLLPAVRALAPHVPVVAMGTSCRQQIAHGAGRRALHLAELLRDRLRAAQEVSPPAP